MKVKNLIITLLLCIVACTLLIPCADGQKISTQLWKKMRYKVDEFNDTVFLAELPPAYKYAKGKGKRKKSDSWRKYYRLVYNFAKVYPYALVAKDIVGEVDSTIRAQNLRYIRKDKYVSAIVKDLFKTYEKPLTNMTVTQGQILMKLIDRECDICPYDIIKQFKNGYAAGFWQGVAKLFGNNLKKHYDPYGEDRNLELLVEKWEDGSFRKLYFDIFGKDPPNMEMDKAPEKKKKR